MRGDHVRDSALHVLGDFIGHQRPRGHLARAGLQVARVGEVRPDRDRERIPELLDGARSAALRERGLQGASPDERRTAEEESGPGVRRPERTARRSIAFEFSPENLLTDGFRDRVEEGAREAS